MSDGGKARLARSESVEVTLKVERTAVRRLLHRVVRPLNLIAPDSPAVHPGQKGRAF